jgi:hypothetical protein
MANVLTALAPVLYTDAQTVSNEPYAVLNSITTNYDDKGVAKGDTVFVPIAPVRAASDFTPGAVTVQGDDSTPVNVGVKITQSKKVSWYLTGEQSLSLANGGSNGVEMARQWVLQGMRTLRNLAEADAATAVKAGASRAYGTAGTNPFATDLSGLTNMYKMLKDNGAPMADLQLIVNTTAGLSLRNQGIIQQAYQAGSAEERRSGNLLKQFGFSIAESAGIGLHTKGTGASYVTSGSTAPGVQAIALVTGTGTVLAGDIVTFAADTNNKYVAAGDPSAALLSAPGTFSLGRPGALTTIATANAMTIGGNYTANLAFERSAVMGVFRTPAMPENPTIKQLKITDASGLTFLLLEITQYGQVSWELHLAYGTKVVQQEHTMILLG